MEHCAVCHGPEGEGDPQRRPLEPGVVLTRSELIRRQADGVVYRRIAFGWGAMPGFSHQLEHEDLLAVAEYTLSLGRDPQPAPASR